MKNSTFFACIFKHSFNATLLLVLALMCGFSHSLKAQSSNPKISIQGTLKTANGSSVSDGTYTLKFKLYNVRTGGTALWQEDTTVEVIGSIYSHYLGSVNALNPADFSNTLYLGVTVGSYELIPRSELSYSPYAFAVYSTVCSGALGDIKYSILNPTQFAAANGVCWVPMDGRALASNDQLRVVTGMTNVPNGGGMFLRSQEFSGGADNDPDRTSATAIGTVEGEALKSHNHGVNDPGHGHGFNDLYRSDDGSSYDVAGGRHFTGPLTSTPNNTTNNTTNISIQNNGGSETRPKNLNFWVYIRIN